MLQVRSQSKWPSTMTHELRAVALSSDQILRALPLIQVTWPSVDSHSWQSFVEFFHNRTKGNGAGVIALGDPADYLSGIIVYEIGRDLEKGMILTIQLFTAVDLANSTTPIRALFETAITKAMDLGCGGLQIRLYDEQTALGSQLRRLGLSDRAGYLWKRVSAIRSAG